MLRRQNPRPKLDWVGRAVLATPARLDHGAGGLYSSSSRKTLSITVAPPRMAGTITGR